MLYLPFLFDSRRFMFMVNHEHIKWTPLCQMVFSVWIGVELYEDILWDAVGFCFILLTVTHGPVITRIFFGDVIWES